MLLVGFEPAIPASKQPQTHILAGASTEIGSFIDTLHNYNIINVGNLRFFVYDLELYEWNALCFIPVYFIKCISRPRSSRDITCVFQHQILGLVKRFLEWEQQNILKPRRYPRS